MRASAAFIAALLPLTAIPLRADVGARALFPSGAGVRFGAQSGVLAPSGELVFESGASADQSEDGDTVLFHGESAALDLRFEVSRRLPDGSWTPWLPAYVQRYPGGRFWGKAEVPFGRGALKVRAFSRSRPAREVALYSVQVFTAGDREPDAQNAKPALPPASPKRPPVQERRAWKAAPPKGDYEPQTPERLTLHHTEGRYTTTLADTLQEVKVIQDFHMNGRGWTDIAYHYLIDSQGNIVEGRPELVIGAHAGDIEKNTNNVGIVLLGSHHPPKNDPVTAAAQDAFIQLGRYFVARYRIKPSTLKGHRDLKSTDCPGDVLYALLPRLRGILSMPDPRAIQPIFRPTLLVHPRFE